jgi:hypothetical protein
MFRKLMLLTALSHLLAQLCVTGTSLCSDNVGNTRLVSYVRNLIFVSDVTESEDNIRIIWYIHQIG